MARYVPPPFISLLPEGKEKRLIERGTKTMNDRENVEQVGEYEVPVDPMDELQCDGCQ